MNIGPQWMTGAMADYALYRALYVLKLLAST